MTYFFYMNKSKNFEYFLLTIKVIFYNSKKNPYFIYYYLSYQNLSRESRMERARSPYRSQSVVNVDPGSSRSAGEAPWDVLFMQQILF